MDIQSAKVVFRKSNRVVLRPILEEDLVPIVRWVNDPEVTQFLQVHMPMMMTDEQEWYQGLSKRKPFDIVVAIVVEGKIIGNMGLHQIDFRNGTATTGTLIGEKDFWGKGYGTEAKMLLLDFAFNTLNLRKVCSSVYEFNKRSFSYSLKCGYKEEARLKEHLYSHGKYWDKILLAVFRKEWDPLWEKFAKQHNLQSL